MRLREAADVLDNGRWINDFEAFQAKRLRDEYERGRAVGLAQSRPVPVKQEGDAER